MAVEGEEHGALLLSKLERTKTMSSQYVHLAEGKVVPVPCLDGVWVLDTGATNHMTGTRSALSH